MELKEFKLRARHIVFKMAMLMLQTASDESIKKEPEIQHKIVSTALALPIEAEALEKELDQMPNPGSNNLHGTKAAAV
ncbi:MAG: hypothetical protein NC320_10795 [Clostridium sp.]|nr:hypothetical protein [Clostridium sp.]